MNLGFINEIMSSGEAVKGQALFPMMSTIGTIIASLSGGWILDVYGVKALTGIATLITAAGAAVVIMSVDKVRDHREDPDANMESSRAIL